MTRRPCLLEIRHPADSDSSSDKTVAQTISFGYPLGGPPDPPAGTPPVGLRTSPRREAQGEVVASKPDGKPFDHIADLKGARNGTRHGTPAQGTQGCNWRA
ncbi:polymorphic toxin type 28 domain-containing protein [Streptomyces sp. NPDC005402]|uniref:polymorphic toxin type 28 domain-containing protein n=1 Tax=Streptomyces sp. NPDC005402 TaxID=3155338 RepID=UPI0033A5F817